jgi:uncharacterized protein YbjT (DUF2867 family)
MHIILGGTGHVGSAVAETLLAQGEPVTIVTRNEARAGRLKSLGALVAVADVHDPERLRDVYRRGTSLFLLNPPAPVSSDTDAEERRTVASITAALHGSGLKKIVAESTSGARPGDRIGDLSVLYEMEEAIRATSIPSGIIRAAYYMSNWDSALETARNDGVVHTMFPIGLEIPMVAPEDLGRAGASLLTQVTGGTGIHYVEGPRRYSSAGVAAAFAGALGRPVEAVQTPRDQWQSAFKALGFSDAAAVSYARMTAAVVDDDFPPRDIATRGSITIEEYVHDLVERAPAAMH